jgi:microsomal prostaglandin-E synthase 2
MDALTLYQFELCPFCHKVKASLDLKGLPFHKVEVDPYSKSELPSLPEGTPRKVPVLQHDGSSVQDSTAILSFLESSFPEQTPLVPDDAAMRTKAEEIEAWVDDDLTQVLPTVLYGTWGEARRAAQVTARTSNFGFVRNLMVRAGGPLIMHQVAKRIVKKRGGSDPHQMLSAELDKLEAWLGDDEYLCGPKVSLGDAAAHGALTCMREFPAFGRVTERPRLAAWYARVQAIRDANKVSSGTVDSSQRG